MCVRLLFHQRNVGELHCSRCKPLGLRQVLCSRDLDAIEKGRRFLQLIDSHVSGLAYLLRHRVPCEYP